MKKLGLCYTVQMGPYYEAFQIAQANGLAVGEATPPVKLAMKSGVTVVGGTDSTRIGEFNTWRAVEYQITGRAVGGSVQRRKDLGLTCQEALKLYTSNASWATFDEGQRGTLESGKLADLAILDQPYLTIAEDKIHTLKSQLTLVGGKVRSLHGTLQCSEIDQQRPRHLSPRMSALGHRRTFAAAIGMSALPPKADMCSATRSCPLSANSGHPQRQPYGVSLPMLRSRSAITALFVRVRNESSPTRRRAKKTRVCVTPP